MEYELVDAGKCRKRLTLNFSVAEVAEAFDESYAELDNYVQVKGFRKGRAPRRILEKKYSREAAEGAEEKLAQKNIQKAIEESSLKVMSAVAGIPGAAGIVAGQPFKLAVEFDVRPEFELPEYKGLELAEQPIEVDEEQVAAAMDQFRRMFAKHEKIDEPAKPMDIVNVDFKAEAEGKEIMDMADKNLRIDGDQLFGMPYPDLVEKFTGVKAGDQVDVDITLPEDHPDETLRNKKAAVSMKVNYVERPELPELDDAFAANLGMGSLEDFRNRIRMNMTREAITAARGKKENEVVDQLIAATSFDIPDNAVKNETAAILEQNRQELMQRGLNGQALDAQIAGMAEEAAKLGERRVRWEIIASAIAEKEDVKVSNEELSAHIEALAASYKTTPAKLIQRIREFDGVGMMVKESRDIKVMQLIIDAAKGGAADPDAVKNETKTVNADSAESAVNPEGEEKAE